MQRISRAPELSATRSLDSCWIIDLLRLLQDLDQAPALGPRQRPRLDDPHEVALARLVALVVRVQLARAAHDLLVLRMAPRDLDRHRDRLVRLARDDAALAGLAARGVRLGRRGAGPPLLLAAALPAVGGALAGGLLAGLAAGCCALLGGLLRARLGRAPGSLQASARLPVEAFEGVVSAARLRRSLLGRGFLSRSVLRLRLFSGSLLRLRLLVRSLLRLRLLLCLFVLLVLLFVCHQTLSSCSRSIPRCLATVSRRATSRRTWLMRAVFSSSPVACWRRSANCSSRVWRMRSTSSSSLRLCASEDFMTAAPRPRGERTSS